MRWAFVVCAFGVVAGCASTPQQASAPPPPLITCQTGADCDAKWSRAIGWLANNSAWKIQSQSDLLIQTFNSINDSPSPGFTVTKVATGQPGTYEINFAGGCANLLGCIPSVAESRASFAAFVTGGTPAPATMVWVRKDHRRTKGNPALEKQVQADREKCQADATKAAQPGNPAAFDNAYKGCMDVRGYNFEPLEQALLEVR
jgi:hypothetical protein